MGPKPTPKALPRLKAQSGTRRSAAKAELRLQLQNGSAAPNKTHLSKLKGFGSQPYGPPRGDGRRHRSPHRAGIQRWEWERGGGGGGDPPRGPLQSDHPKPPNRSKKTPRAQSEPRKRTQSGGGNPPPPQRRQPRIKAAPHQSGPAPELQRSALHRRPRRVLKPRFPSFQCQPPPLPPPSGPKNSGSTRAERSKPLYCKGAALQTVPQRGRNPPGTAPPCDAHRAGLNLSAHPHDGEGAAVLPSPPPPLSIHVG